MATQQQYAQTTSVPISRSKEHIEDELRRLNATKRIIYEDDEERRVTLMFERQGRRYRLYLPLLDPTDERFYHTPQRRVTRSNTQAYIAWEQDCRARWRELYTYLKAIRIAAEAGIIAVEEALLPYVVLPSGETLGEYLEPQLHEATQGMPSLLPGVGRQHPMRLIEEPRDEED